MSNLKQSAPDWCFYDAEIGAEKYYAKLKEIGYTGVEMLPAERRAIAKKAGLKIINLGAPGMQVGLSDPANHKKLVADTIKTIEEANRDEISHVIVFSGNRNGQKDAVGVKNCITAIEQYLPVAEKNGIILVFEMLNSINHQDYQADSSAYGFTIARHFNSPYMKVLYDIYHMFRMGEDVVADITGNLEYIAHIHIAGAPKRNCPAFENEIDYPAIVKPIVAAGYKGFWGQEFCITDDRWAELAGAYKYLENI